MSDFWMDGNQVNSLVYRLTRPLYISEEVVRDAESFEYIAPEVLHGEPVTKASDVMLLGMLFVSLLQGRIRGISNLSELRYTAHQLLQMKSQIPVSLHTWAGKSTNISPAGRYSSVADQMNDYHGRLESFWGASDYPNVIYNIQAITDDGVQKRARAKDPDDVNQDRYILLQDKGKALVVVADGITTAKYGRGSLAAQYIIDVARNLWQENSAELSGKKEVESFLTEFIRQANEMIVQHTDTLVPEDVRAAPSELMGSTCTAALVIGNTAYTISIGDSRIYQWSPQYGLQLLHADQNIINDSLSKGIEWSEVYDSEDESSLIAYLGMADSSEKPLKPRSIDFTMNEVKLDIGDMLFLCSDGVTDYLYPIGHQNDVWKVDEIIDNLLYDFAKEQSPLQNALEKIVELANLNGGGDNITAVILQLETYKAAKEEITWQMSWF
ncbi:protein phosphatase 2C domain-containing protein [Paenibacillus sp. CCS19]|uniref:PP2C family protein-serine/threonine phosphatase n=1 Tax=Paenibacillus sp. CCS19 TaxID=3158387 RepID=UPI00295E78CF|nr:protein phosphatase 2C domain-containing protein [Paenibacillus cellulosilyticus]